MDPTPLLPMIGSLLERWPLERVVLVADRGLLSLNNLQELARLRARLGAAGRDVRLEYVLAVPGVLATLLAIHVGFTAVIVAALVLYALAMAARPSGSMTGCGASARPIA